MRVCKRRSARIVFKKESARESAKVEALRESSKEETLRESSKEEALRGRAKRVQKRGIYCWSSLIKVREFGAIAEVRSYVKVEVAVLNTLFLISLVVSVDVKKHLKKKKKKKGPSSTTERPRLALFQRQHQGIKLPRDWMERTTWAFPERADHTNYRSELNRHGVMEDRL